MALPLPLTPIDGYPTHTSRLQHETEVDLLKHLPGQPKSAASPTVLQKNSHVQFVARNLIHGFGERYISQDASQPWLMFWTLQSLACLGVMLDPTTKQRVIDKILTWQHPKGGFGGGPGQAAHLLTTYASICSLAIVGRPGPGGGWDDIDRPALSAFYHSLKQPDGSFLVAHHAEVDIRGIYCMLVVATMLDIVTPELVAGTPEFVASLQTYEGGFASASFPSYDTAGDRLLPGAPRPALGEAHGGYAFCALAAWVLLQPYLDARAACTPGYARPQINVKSATRWLVSMQGGASELGGFKGRTNKLVDGCYAWWCAGCFGILEALGVGGLNHTAPPPPMDSAAEADSGDEWVDLEGEGLFNSKALQEYVLYACQAPDGGLRDKPSKPADAYHTLYCLSGLSSAQHRITPSAAKKDGFLAAWPKTPRAVDLPVRQEDADVDSAARLASLAALLSWTEDPLFAHSFDHIVGGKENRLNATHPVTNLTVTHTQGISRWAYGIPAADAS